MRAFKQKINKTERKYKCQKQHDLRRRQKKAWKVNDWKQKKKAEKQKRKDKIYIFRKKKAKKRTNAQNEHVRMECGSLEFEGQFFCRSLFSLFFFMCLSLSLTRKLLLSCVLVKELCRGLYFFSARFAKMMMMLGSCWVRKSKKNKIKRHNAKSGRLEPFEPICVCVLASVSLSHSSNGEWSNWAI